MQWNPFLDEEELTSGRKSNFIHEKRIRNAGLAQLVKIYYQ